MVQVTPPEDFSQDAESEPVNPEPKPFVKPVPDPNLPETVSTISSSIADGLKSDAAHGNKPGKKQWQGTQANSGTRGNVEPSPASEPVLPGDHWNSSRSRQRKKLLLAFVTTAAVLVLGIGVTIFVAMQFAGDGSDSELADSSGTGVTDSGLNYSAPNPGGKDSTADANNDRNMGETGMPDKTGTRSGNDKSGSPVDPTSKEPGKNSGSTSAQSSAGDNKAGSGIGPGSKNTGTIDSAKTKDKNPVESGDKVDQKNRSTKSDSAPPEFTSKDDDDSLLPSFFKEFDELDTIFEQDEPLVRLREAVDENDLPGSYGLTRFYISPSLKKKPDPEQALNVPIAGLSFKQTTLQEFLNFHFQLTAVPVSVDVTPIMLAGIQLDQKIDFVVDSEVSVRELLKQFASRMGLELVDGKNSLVLTIPDRNSVTEKEYPVEDLSATPEDRQNLIRTVIELVAPSTWSQNGGPGIITANDAKQSLVVKHEGWAHVRVKDFLRHARLRRNLPLKNPNPNYPENRHRLVAAELAKQKRIDLVYPEPVSLGQLWADLANKQGLFVFVNWEATGSILQPSGSLPLAIEKEAFGGFIDELAAGSRLQVVWHSATVVELTTDIGASTNLLLESHDIRRVTSRAFPADRLVSALARLLASHHLDQYPLARIQVDPLDPGFLYVLLPQKAQENVVKILQTAESAIRKD